ncbi:hypothetical protein HYV73_04120 [Candidatus Uhrbacteria bacterium]|nr:hypothetical protein [Candidatus Uhrbacteria bacterium]
MSQNAQPYIFVLYLNGGEVSYTSEEWRTLLAGDPAGRKVLEGFSGHLGEFKTRKTIARFRYPNQPVTQFLPSGRE